MPVTTSTPAIIGARNGHLARFPQYRRRLRAEAEFEGRDCRRRFILMLVLTRGADFLWPDETELIPLGVPVPWTGGARRTKAEQCRSRSLCLEEGFLQITTSPFILPYEPGYIGLGSR